MDAQLLTLVLDELIPPRSDNALQGAGTLGLGPLVEQAATESSRIGQVLAKGLGTLEEMAQSTNQGSFGALPRAARVKLLQALERAEPMFIQTLMTLACVGYYSNERVLEALNGDARPPHPAGHTLAPDDWSILELVRVRPKLYREC